ncbi:MAG: hypothetical protein LJD31_03580, partial [Wolbachia endosymbiont of Menacanthus eurysternus]|nr:hypothetical protein [Wolbachia endosymbiont of Menacanthus eurysternus]
YNTLLYFFLLSLKTPSKSELEKNKNQHSQTSEVSLKKSRKKPPLSKVAYVSLVATSVVGSILRIVCPIDDYNFCDICVGSWRHYIHNVKAYH